MIYIFIEVRPNKEGWELYGRTKHTNNISKDKWCLEIAYHDKDKIYSGIVTETVIKAAINPAAIIQDTIIHLKNKLEHEQNG